MYGLKHIIKYWIIKQFVEKIHYQIIWEIFLMPAWKKMKLDIIIH